MKPLIHVAEVCKIYNRHRPDEMVALQDVSLAINEGEVVALTGPSGSGKTTLLSLLGCMGRPTSGIISLRERQVSKLPERFLARIRRESFGFVFQQYNLLRDVSLLDNVMLPLYPTGKTFRQMKRSALKVLGRFGLETMANKKVKLLSGGEQQRVAIARALVGQPEIIIADEPTAHLDSQLTGELLGLFTLLREEGKTLIIATHDPFLIQSGLIGRQISMRFGHIEKDTPR